MSENSAESSHWEILKLTGLLFLHSIKKKTLITPYVFRPLWVDPIKVDLKGGLTLFSMPPPGSGVLLAVIMKLLDGLNLDKLGSADPLSYHRMAEAMKHAYLFVPGINEVRSIITFLKMEKFS